MKKIIRGLGIAALAVIVGFAMTACDGGSSNRTPDLPPAGDGRITFDGPHTFPVFTWAGTRFDGDQAFTHILRWDEATETEYLLALSTALNAPSTVSITDGTLALQLGRPSASAPWIDVSANLPRGFTTTPGLRLFVLWEFATSEFSTSNGHNYLFWSGTNGEVGFFYADRAGRVSGAYFNDYYGEWFLTNWDLRQGWNTIINTWTATAGHHSVTGRPGSNFRWVVDRGGPAIVGPGPDYMGGPSDSGFNAFSTDISQTGREERERAISRLFR